MERQIPWSSGRSLQFLPPHSLLCPLDTESDAQIDRRRNGSLWPPCREEQPVHQRCPSWFMELSVASIQHFNTVHPAFGTDRHANVNIVFKCRSPRVLGVHGPYRTHGTGGFGEWDELLLRKRARIGTISADGRARSTSPDQNWPFLAYLLAGSPRQLPLEEDLHMGDRPRRDLNCRRTNADIRVASKEAVRTGRYPRYREVAVGIGQDNVPQSLKVKRGIGDGFGATVAPDQDPTGDRAWSRSVGT